jgi:hypothetical protein
MWLYPLEWGSTYFTNNDHLHKHVISWNISTLTCSTIAFEIRFIKNHHTPTPHPQIRICFFTDTPTHPHTHNLHHAASWGELRFPSRLCSFASLALFPWKLALLDPPLRRTRWSLVQIQHWRDHRGSHWHDQAWRKQIAWPLSVHRSGDDATEHRRSRCGIRRWSEGLLRRWRLRDISAHIPRNQTIHICIGKTLHSEWACQHFNLVVKDWVGKFWTIYSRVLFRIKLLTNFILQSFDLKCN